MRVCAGHQHVKQLAALLRLAVSPLRRRIAEKSPDGIVGRLFRIADKTVERRGVTPFEERDVPPVPSPARMSFHETEEVARHIPFAFGQAVIPALALLLEQQKQAVLRKTSNAELNTF